MKACFMGLGYIGLPTAIIAAKHGVEIAGVDINAQVVEVTNQGKLHIIEPGMEEMLREVLASGHFKAYTEPQVSDAYFMVVPTPFKGDHEPDVSFVESATRMVLPLLKEGDLYVIESTSPVGTTELMASLIFSERPELKGKIAMGDPTASSSAFAELTNMLLDMGEGDTPADRYMSDAAWDYIAKFIDNIDGIVLSSSSQVYKNVIAGEYAVGVSYEDPVVQAIIDNKDNPDADLSLVYPEEGAVWLPAGVAIVKNAPNMDNAKLFVDYVLSEEAQTALSKTTIRGTMTSIAQDCPEMKPFEEINVVYEDQAAVAELQTEMLEKWTNLLTK